MFYTIYRVTNKVNGMIYLGKHQASNLNDSYIGSGKYIRDAVRKYGKESFSKEILYVFDTEDEMNAKERELITEEFVARRDTYNLGVGGEGGAQFKGKTHSAETKQILSSKARRIRTDEERAAMSAGHWSKKDPERFKLHISKIASKERTAEHRKKLSEAGLGKKQNVIVCPVCNKTGGERSMKRWHFNNCKFDAG